MRQNLAPVAYYTQDPGNTKVFIVYNTLRIVLSSGSMGNYIYFPNLPMDESATVIVLKEKEDLLYVGMKAIRTSRQMMILDGIKYDVINTKEELTRYSEKFNVLNQFWVRTS